MKSGRKQRNPHQDVNAVMDLLTPAKSYVLPVGAYMGIHLIILTMRAMKKRRKNNYTFFCLPVKGTDEPFETTAKQDGIKMEGRKMTVLSTRTVGRVTVSFEPDVEGIIRELRSKLGIICDVEIAGYENGAIITVIPREPVSKERIKKVLRYMWLRIEFPRHGYGKLVKF